MELGAVPQAEAMYGPLLLTSMLALALPPNTDPDSGFDPNSDDERHIVVLPVVLRAVLPYDDEPCICNPNSWVGATKPQYSRFGLELKSGSRSDGRTKGHNARGGGGDTDAHPSMNPVAILQPYSYPRSKALLSAGAHPDKRQGCMTSGRTPLFMAAEAGAAELAGLLVDRGAAMELEAPCNPNPNTNPNQIIP